MRTSDRDYKNPNHVYRGPSTFSSANILMGTCIDHIFATNDVTSLYHSLIIDEDALNASDHAPIYSDLQFAYSSGDTPSTPETPDHPDTPVIPDVPEIPDNPDNPDNPDIPDNPNNPNDPTTGNVSKVEGYEDEDLYWGPLS